VKTEFVTQTYTENEEVQAQPYNPQCGNQQIDYGEQCDTKAVNTCPPGQVCQHCNCVMEQQQTELSCEDGFDNDGDERVDCDDEDCRTHSSCAWLYETTQQCGDGNTQPGEECDFAIPDSCENPLICSKDCTCEANIFN